MKKPHQLLFFLAFAWTSVQSQTNNNHLLWRISGNGLSKPSYLFGTMHLTDKRLFQFGDSLYRALEQSEGFAAELDLNNAFNEYVDKLFGERMSQKYIKDDLDPATLKKYKSRLEKKFKKSVDEITVEDLKNKEQERNAKWMQSGEMQTFMDAYLFGLADKQGKWTGGIEDPEDQFGLDTAFRTESKVEDLLADSLTEEKQLQWMMKIYLDENLDVIDRTSSLWKGSKDAILIRRNIKMAYRVDSLARVRTCLFAVGAAHLPGDTGVVNLLRQRGFTLTPVISSKKIDPAKYTYKEIKKDWVNVYVKDSLYSVQMPVQPAPLKSLEGMTYDMLFHFDLPNYTAYFTFSIPLAGAPVGMQDSMLSNLAKGYKEKSTGFSQKDIKWADKAGKEFTMEAAGFNMKMQAFIPGDYVVLNAVLALKKEGLASPNVTRYFSSFLPDTTRASAKIAKLKKDGWQNFESPTDGFALQAPSKFKSRKLDTGEESAWTRRIYEAADPVTQAYYAVTVDATKKGYYSSEDSTYFEQSKTSVIESMKATEVSAVHTKFRQYPAYDLLIRSERFNTALLTRLLFINTGAHRYVLYKTYDPKAAASSQEDLFFSSFTFIPFPKSDWKKRSVAASGFSTFAPADFVAEGNGEETETTLYSVYDSLSALTMYVDREVMPAYYWTENDSVFFSEKIRSFVGNGDSLIMQTKVMNGNAGGVDIAIQLNASPVLKRMRLVLNADTLYTLYGFISPEILAEPAYKQFFNDFRLQYDQHSPTIFSSKAQRLIDSLHLADSTGFYKAKFALEKAKFTAADIPLLQRSILDVYQDQDTEGYEWDGVNALLSNKLLDVDTAYTSTAFIKENYSKLASGKEHIKMVLLNTLSSQQSKASYDLLRELIRDQLPDTNNVYFSFGGLYDSLELSGTLFPDVFLSFNNRMIVNEFGPLAVTLYDSGYINKKMLTDHRSHLINAAKAGLALSKEEFGNYSYTYSQLVELIAKINDAETNQLLRRYAQSGDLYVKKNALMNLVKNGQTVSRNDFLPVAKSDEYRSDLYNELEEAELLKLFPLEYLSQKQLGQSVVYYQADDEQTPDQIVYIGERTISFKGSKKKFFLYKVVFKGEEDEGEETTYLGVAGGYSLDPKDMTASGDTGIYWLEEFDAKAIDKQFKAFIKNQTEPEED